MDKRVRYVDLCGNCNRGRCRFFVRVNPDAEHRVVTCTGRGDFISGLPGFVPTEMINPSDEQTAQWHKYYCTNTSCEALIFGDQAPGMCFSLGEHTGMLCRDCIQEIDYLSQSMPHCNHIESIRNHDGCGPSNQTETNHPHWLALPASWCGGEHGVEPGVYCDPDAIPDFQRVQVGVWQTFKLEFTDVEQVRQAYDSIGLQNDVLQRMLLMALDDAMQDSMDFVDMLLEMEQSDDDDDPGDIEVFAVQDGFGPS